MTLPPTDLEKLIESMSAESKAVKMQVAEICYYMNGGVEYNNAWGMSFEDREMMISLINKRRKEMNPNGKEML
jgi:hypothetical protein